MDVTGQFSLGYPRADGGEQFDARIRVTEFPVADFREAFDLQDYDVDGFVNGDWGGGVDLGGYQRWWGTGSTGLQGALVLGAPWGITMSVGAGAGTNDARHYSATLGIDFARLTVYRRSGDSWWKNPFPAYRPGEEL